MKNPTLGAVALAAGVLVATSAPAAAATGADVVTKIETEDRAAALAYWTPERLAATDPENEAPAETIGTVRPGPVPAGLGKLYFTLVPGGDGSCSATAVPSASKDVVLTAGHCVNAGLTPQDEPIQVTNVVFVPSYEDGSGPHGVFAARAFAWPDTYQGPMSGTDDVAVLALDPVDGKHVADTTGTQEVTFERPESPAPTDILGYPVSRLAHGQKVQQCDVTAEYAPDSVVDKWISPCDLAGGSSGGPWLTGFDDATGLGTIYGVTSSRVR
ncbi:serine protease [Amycolatopsis sp. 195334CR]|uniref:trypsin-like serine peptidase n=1 Tax=Amycolatopsis sp. 195334CR TaxID=2814588 RepID=UPI001A8C61C3|nr:hypothetical protein [Amycolatopsis sp. 195334CR]MBN6037625.1 hypothetical protein [Amycolatopsis sp. 195334CR]